MNDLLFKFSLIFMFFASFCCDSDGPSGTHYLYKAYDSVGVVAVAGDLYFKLDSSSVKGQWFINRISNAKNLGPQIGKGDLSGRIVHDTIIEFGFNEGVDNNVFLYGKYKEELILGQWYWSTAAGISNQGTFEAKRD